MCFSATSSFVVATGLTASGIIALKYANKKRLIPLALIPLGFALQQAAEGVVWLTLNQPNALLHTVAVHLYLSFAYIIWPVWMPFALRHFETNQMRKKLLSLCQLFGLLFGITAGFVLFTHPVTAEVIKGHLAYKLQHWIFNSAGSLSWYLIPTILPFFVVSNGIMPFILGSLLSLSLAAAYFFTPEALASVWCFLAAVISATIMGVIWSEGKNNGA